MGPGYVELVHEIAQLKEGSRVGVVCASDRGTENIAETLQIAGTKGVELISATIHDDERLTLIDRTADLIDVEGALLDDLPDRLDRFHYDLVATTTFHADEAQALVHGRVPVVAMLVGPGYLELVHEIAALPSGSRVGLVCASERGADNIAETLALSGTTGVELVSATMDADADLAIIDRTADVILLSREAIASGLDQRFSRPERVRRWSYEFDPAGLELLRRSIENVMAGRRREAVAAS